MHKTAFINEKIAHNLASCILRIINHNDYWAHRTYIGSYHTPGCPLPFSNLNEVDKGNLNMVHLCVFENYVKTKA